MMFTNLASGQDGSWLCRRESVRTRSGRDRSKDERPARERRHGSTPGSGPPVARRGV